MNKVRLMKRLLAFLLFFLQLNSVLADPLPMSMATFHRNLDLLFLPGKNTSSGDELLRLFEMNVYRPEQGEQFSEKAFGNALYYYTHYMYKEASNAEGPLAMDALEKSQLEGLNLVLNSDRLFQKIKNNISIKDLKEIRITESLDLLIKFFEFRPLNDQQLKKVLRPFANIFKRAVLNWLDNDPQTPVFRQKNQLDSFFRFAEIQSETFYQLFFSTDFYESQKFISHIEGDGISERLAYLQGRWTKLEQKMEQRKSNKISDLKTQAQTDLKRGEISAGFVSETFALLKRIYAPVTGESEDDYLDRVLENLKKRCEYLYSLTNSVLRSSSIKVTPPIVQLAILVIEHSPLGLEKRALNTLKLLRQRLETMDKQTSTNLFRKAIGNLLILELKHDTPIFLKTKTKESMQTFDAWKAAAEKQFCWVNWQ